MSMSRIMRRTSVGVAAAGAACAIGLATAPTASAAPAVQPVQPVQAVGSVAICFGIPIGPVTISVCL
ncbi:MULTISPECIES: hypothetical protein [Gordonia]|uniref:Uncharacterized protein n=2 Tax=Gordonia terrae TaxID=2055 RepID=A0A2I1R6P9_9ACTN|nr:hypothetical protein [Gordonia terrae]VTR08125.1 Uncharacterised protein [Clostridioides difficile]ANY25244.1 hypothetical protein BCM27_22680 [Gordonia terrae]AWO85994.1 hypothetical protein DLJ61_22920 [Gordonia terrae]PKZ64768.1 hypothetical protein CYJ73_15290 [Gordonia terrae]VTS62368.1 Uncharacterised protein [Gordonia terrae]